MTEETFPEKAEAEYTKQFLEAYQVENIPENDEAYGKNSYGGNNNFAYGRKHAPHGFTHHQKHRFDNATRHYIAANIQHYLELVKENYDNGVFDASYKKETWYGYNEDALKTSITHEMHPRTMVRTLMIAEINHARIAALRDAGILYNDDNNRFASDPINDDILYFGADPSHRKGPESGQRYKAMQARTEDIKTFAGLLHNAEQGGVISSEALQNLIEASKKLGFLSVQHDATATGVAEDVLDLKLTTGGELKIRTHVQSGALERR